MTISSKMAEDKDIVLLLELSDNRLWVLDPRDGGWEVSSALDNSRHYSHIGHFDNLENIHQFARDYLQLKVVAQVTLPRSEARQ